MKIIILKPAQAELDDAADYYADHASLRIAQAFLDDFEHARRRLAEYPEIGLTVSKYLRIPHLRHFPYAIIYRLSENTIKIQAVAHHRRKPRHGARP